LHQNVGDSFKKTLTQIKKGEGHNLQFDLTLQVRFGKPKVQKTTGITLGRNYFQN